MNKVRNVPIDTPCTKCLAPAGEECACIPRGVHFQHLSSEIQKSLRGAVKRCESPIEKLLLVGLQIQTMGHPDIAFSVSVEVPDYAQLDRGQVVCVPQVTIGPYRSDFALFVGGKREVIVIECDGHDFHERTKEQARRDRARDRWMTTSGFTVLRFTGSEIHNDTFAVCDEIVEYLERP